MQRFAYRAYDTAGRMQSGETTARDRAEVLGWLRSRGFLPVEVERGGASAVRWWNRELTRGAAVSSDGLAMFVRELGTLLEAHVPLDQALEIIALQPAMNRRLREVLGRLLDDVRDGAPLGEAMSRHDGFFPDYLPRLVSAGESSGALPKALADLATFLEATNASRQRLAAALVYPAILMLAAIAALAVVVGVLVPAIVPLLQEAGAPLPPVIAGVQGFVDALRAHGVIFGAACMVVVLCVLVGAGTSAAAREQLARVWLRVPMVGGLAVQSGTMRYARTLAMLLRNGVPMLDALDKAAATVGNAGLRADLGKAEASVREGRMLSQALRDVTGVPEMAVRLVGVGEHTGDLPAMLDRVADIYQASVQRRLDRMAVLVTPVLTILIGVVVGLLVLAVLDALAGINSLALR